ncbi:MAG: prenyltransferase/squalene oxidase repeat-containing protein [Planctomycetota bacterium]
MIAWMLGSGLLGLVLLGSPAVDEAPEPVSATELESAVRGAVHWLVENQHDDGGWGSHHSPRPIEVLCDVPGSHNAFRVATSGLCVSALLDSPLEGEAARKAASRGVDYLIGAHDVKRANKLEHYSVWAFGYALQAFGEWLQAYPDDPRRAEIEAACETLAVKLKKYQTLDGGWGYLSLNEVATYQPSFTSMSFTTATILVGVERAQEIGIRFDEKVLSRSLKFMKGSETPEGNFLYGEYLKYGPRTGINQDKGSACRTPACQYAIGLFGEQYSEEARRKALDDLLVKHIRFQKIGVRRPIPHEAWYSISGYFYLYGMAYAGYVYRAMPEADRTRFAKPLFDAVMYCHQPDGSFWDYPLYSYHKPYGTAYALIALSRIQAES